MENENSVIIFSNPRESLEVKNSFIFRLKVIVNENIVLQRTKMCNRPGVRWETGSTYRTTPMTGNRPISDQFYELCCLSPLVVSFSMIYVRRDTKD